MSSTLNTSTSAASRWSFAPTSGVPARRASPENPRVGEPSIVETLERAAALIEGGSAALAFRSGGEALGTLLRTLEAGDEIVVARELLGGPAGRVLAEYAELGVVVRAVDPMDVVGVAGAITRRTRWVWVPEIARARQSAVEIERIATIARVAGVRTLVDVTATSVGPRAIARGADGAILWDSSRLSGREGTGVSLLVLGDARIAFSLELVRDGSASRVGLGAAAEVLAGIETASERARLRVEQAGTLAAALSREAGVRSVRRAEGGGTSGAVVLVELEGGVERASAVARRLRLWREGDAGVASSRWSIQELNGTLRLSPGAEPITDLVADVRRALADGRGLGASVSDAAA